MPPWAPCWPWRQPHSCCWSFCTVPPLLLAVHQPTGAAKSKQQGGLNIWSVHATTLPLLAIYQLINASKSGGRVSRAFWSICPPHCCHLSAAEQPEAAARQPKGQPWMASPSPGGQCNYLKGNTLMPFAWHWHHCGFAIKVGPNWLFFFTNVMVTPELGLTLGCNGSDQKGVV